MMSTASKTPAACLIGWPAAHSRSPLIHRYWLRTLGIAGGYVIEAVPPDDFSDFVRRLSMHGFVGANVTRPHKERALALSKPDARASAVGAAQATSGVLATVLDLTGLEAGRDNAATPAFFSGTLDEAAAYPTALSPVKVEAHFAAGHGG